MTSEEVELDGAWVVVGPLGQRTVISLGALPSGQPKNVAAEDWL